MTDRVFASRYRKGMLMLPPLALAAAPAAIVGAILLTNNVAAGILMGLGLLALFAWSFTLQRRRNPALVLSDAGMALEGLPLIAWRDILGVSRNAEGGYGALDVRLRSPIVEWSKVTRTPARASPIWRPAGGAMVTIRTALLEDRIEDVEDAFRFFLKPG